MTHKDRISVCDYILLDIVINRIQNKALDRRTMSVFVRMSVFVVVMLGSATAKLATVSGGRSNSELHGLMDPREYVDAYFQCYQVFMDNYSTVSALRDICLILDKLTLCKQKVTAAFPRVLDWVIMGGEGEEEFIATFWCTHKPDPYIPMFALYYKFNHCPYTYEWFMVLPEDYSPQARLSFTRARFAYGAVRSINLPRLTRWHPQSNYSDPADPVYQGLSSYYCARHSYIQYRAQIVDKYWYRGDIYRDLNEQIAQYRHVHYDGLYNWDPSMCPSQPEDPLKKMLNVGDLEGWLKLQVNSSLDPCHASNVAVRGGSCIIIHHTRLPPYIDLHLFMQGFCQPIQELSQCWEKVVQMCPKQSVNSDMATLVKLHQLACDLSLQNSSLVWDVIYRWSSAVRKVEGSQVRMQELSSAMSSITNPPYQSTTVYPLPFASTLNATLTTQPHITPQIRSLLQQLVSHLDRINILATYRFQGLNLLHELFQINHNIAGTITNALHGPVELLLTVGGFIDYDPKNFKQWTFLY